MKENYTHITVVLDRSGSMIDIKQGTIDGFNEFLQGQKLTPGECSFTLVQFDHFYDVVYEDLNIQEVSPLSNATFIPRGKTALLDAVGRSINSLGAHLGGIKEQDRPSRVVFVIITDGEENASREFTKSQINEMINHQHEAYNWQFIFLGANQDAIKVASEIGIQPQSAMTYAATDTGARKASRAVSDNLRSYRGGRASALVFTDKDRTDQATERAKK